MKIKLFLPILCTLLALYPITSYAKESESASKEKNTKTVTEEQEISSVVCPIKISYEKEVQIYDGFIPTDETAILSLSLHSSVEYDSPLADFINSANGDVATILNTAGLSDNISCGYEISAYIDTKDSVTINSITTLDPVEILTTVLVETKAAIDEEDAAEEEGEDEEEDDEDLAEESEKNSDEDSADVPIKNSAKNSIEDLDNKDGSADSYEPDKSFGSAESDDSDDSNKAKTSEESNDSDRLSEEPSEEGSPLEEASDESEVL